MGRQRRDEGQRRRANPMAIEWETANEPGGGVSDDIGTSRQTAAMPVAVNR